MLTRPGAQLKSGRVSRGFAVLFTLLSFLKESGDYSCLSTTSLRETSRLRRPGYRERRLQGEDYIEATTTTAAGLHARKLMSAFGGAILRGVWPSTVARNEIVELIEDTVVSSQVFVFFK